jgi:hypothetical protein
LLILDAGSGSREFDLNLAGSGEPPDADILLCHTHGAVEARRPGSTVMMEGMRLAAG